MVLIYLAQAFSFFVCCWRTETVRKIRGDFPHADRDPAEGELATVPVIAYRLRWSW